MADPHDGPARRVSARGVDLLRDPRLNKGSAFTAEERLAFGLEGLLPHHVSALEEQVTRVIGNLRREPRALDRYSHLRSLQDRNETLFYATLIEHLAELMPIVYTPTVAEAVEQFSHIFTSARGLYVTPDDLDRMDMLLANAGCQDVAIIVCTDNEGILGIGDQGTGGMAIPIGKLALYVAAAGFRPEQCLPVCLDVGTQNPTLLSDPLYLGVNSPRLRGDEYDRLIGAFVAAVRRAMPRAVLQWEDFSRDIAFENLQRYRGELTSFNDDIQGTAAVTVASLMGAARLAERPFADERVCIIGAGGAGVGVAEGIMAALRQAGLDEAEARQRVLLFDSKGLLVDDRADLPDYKRQVAAHADRVKGWPGRSLHEVLAQVRPTALIGLSGHPGGIDREAAELMASFNARPAIFPMSNPTANAEAVPADLLEWTGGRAIVATGSPFEPVEYQGRVVRSSQANNVYVFPGVGLGTYACGASAVSDGMLAAAARRLHELTGEDEYAQGLVLPPVAELRSIAAEVGAAVAAGAAAEGLARTPLPEDGAAELTRRMFVPGYVPYEPGGEA
jgi:malic enzyme